MVYVCRSYAVRGPMRANMEIECRTMHSAAEKKRMDHARCERFLRSRFHVPLALSLCFSVFRFHPHPIPIPTYLRTYPTLTVSGNFRSGGNSILLALRVKIRFA